MQTHALVCPMRSAVSSSHVTRAPALEENKDQGLFLERGNFKIGYMDLHPLNGGMPVDDSACLVPVTQF
eukprot:4213941-Amphidinium_carterae.1